jgi:phosphatidylglycerol lysyltransferase
VFYQTTADHLPLYIELGLTLLKIGEEGSVDISGFSFDGPRRADFRKAIRRLEEAGGSYEVVPVDRVPQLIPELESISDAWLAKWNATEKGFSMGSFDPEYMRRNPVGVVRVGGAPVAFGNVLIAGGHEISYDLIRYRPDAPKSSMDYLFAKLIQWGGAQGFERMGLGMAPLSGLVNEPLAPLWNRFGATVYRYGSHFYNFQGLRAYKEKFDPVWEARYIAAPPGLALPGVLTDVAYLIAGGGKGIVRN